MDLYLFLTVLHLQFSKHQRQVMKSLHIPNMVAYQILERKLVHCQHPALSILWLLASSSFRKGKYHANFHRSNLRLAI